MMDFPLQDAHNDNYFADLFIIDKLDWIWQTIQQATYEISLEYIAWVLFNEFEKII
jgi:hypothetical protein